MFKRILTPLDGSQLSEGILPYVRALAPAFGARVDLLRVFQDPAHELFTPDDSDSASITAALEPVVQLLHRRANEYLSEAAQGLAELGVQTVVTVRSGPAALHIVNEANEVDGTLIAMSTHGRTGVGRWVMGSVTDRVLHTTSAPLLVVHPERGSPPPDSVASIKTLIAALDGSDLAETVLPVVAELAKAVSAEVTLLRTVGVPSGYYAEEEDSAPLGVGVLSQMEDAAEEYLGTQAALLRKSGVALVRTSVTRGTAAVEIEELARQTPDSMIVACTHGRSGVGRTVLGSVTDRLARHSGHPVLIVRAPADGR